jgi:hypothetical protein
MAFVRWPVTTVLPIPLLRQAAPILQDLSHFIHFLYSNHLGMYAKIKTHHPASYLTLIPTASFCYRPKQEVEFEAISAVYRGVDKYWAWNAQRKCKTQINVELG